MIAPTPRLVRTDDSCHWYSRDGRPMHRVPKKSGDREKNTTIREARELSLLPSVTTILKLYPKPVLQGWLVEQGILSALTLPRNEGEELQAFAHRVVEDSQRQAKDAAEFGAKIHNAIAGDPVEDPKVQPFLDTYKTWESKMILHVIWSEKILVSDLGYAGRADAMVMMKDGRKILLDYKCRTVKDRAKPPTYETDLMQLCSYEAIEHADAVASVIIDSQTPSEPIYHEWPALDHPEAFATFLACHNLWCCVNGYRP